MSEDRKPVYIGRIALEGHNVWFRLYRQEPTEEEMKAWAPRYAEEIRQRGPRNPLIIDVEGDKLRGV